MSEVRLSGIIEKIEKVESPEVIRIILAIPTWMKVLRNHKFEETYKYISFKLIESVFIDYSSLKVGDEIQIVGEILENCEKNKFESKELSVFPKSIRKGLH